MTTPFKEAGVVLSRDSTVFDLRTRLYHCHDWTDLEAAPPKFGGDRRIPQVRGAARRDRHAGSLRGGFALRVNGRWTDDSTPQAGTLDDWIGAMQDAWDALKAFLDDDAPIDVHVHRLGSSDLEGSIQVENPTWDLTFAPPWRANVTVQFSHAPGALDETGS